MDTISLEKSHLFTMQQDVRQIAQPLFDHSDITAFTFIRKYRNNTATILSTMPDFLAIRYHKNTLRSYKNTQAFVRQLDQPKNRLGGALYFFFKDYDPIAYSLAEKNSFSSFIVFVNENKEHIDSFAFASSGKNISRDYFKHWSSLGYFRNEFICESNRLIKDSNQTKIILPKDEKIITKENNIHMFNTDKLNALFKAKHYYLTYKKITYKLTARQFECVKCLSQGRTIKEVALVMGISPRTVEIHQQNIENIFGVDSRREIIDIYLASNLAGLL